GDRAPPRALPRHRGDVGPARARRAAGRLGHRALHPVPPQHRPRGAPLPAQLLHRGPRPAGPGGAGAGVREAGTAAVDAPGPAAARLPGRAGQAAGRGATGPRGHDPPGARGRAGRHRRGPVPALRPVPAGQRLHRAGARGDAARRHRGGRQGPPAGRRRAGRRRPRDPAEPRRPGRPPLGGRRRLRPAGPGRGVRPHAARRARLPGRGPQRRALRRELRGQPRRAHPQGLLGDDDLTGPDAGADQRPQGQRPRRAGRGGHRPPRAGRPGHRGGRADDLRRRLLPRRPAPGQPVHRAGRPDRPHRLRHGRRRRRRAAGAAGRPAGRADAQGPAPDRRRPGPALDVHPAGGPRRARPGHAGRRQALRRPAARRHRGGQADPRGALGDEAAAPAAPAGVLAGAQDGGDDGGDGRLARPVVQHRGGPRPLRPAPGGRALHACVGGAAPGRGRRRRAGDRHPAARPAAPAAGDARRGRPRGPPADRGPGADRRAARRDLQARDAGRGRRRRRARGRRDRHDHPAPAAGLRRPL
ncbi:MAG: ABC1 family protein, partial [uncultured Friedmanniella sp.]